MQYWRQQLWRIDFSLAMHYSVGRAYRVSLSNRHQIPKGSRAFLTYGETPLSTFLEICSWFDHSPGMQFMELGCGTGRLCLMSAKSWGLNCTGIDLISPFIQNARRMARRLKLPCEFIEGNILEADWSGADILYLTSTTYSDELLEQVWKKCASLRVGARLITLTHAPPREYMEVLRQEVLLFSWGAATVYLSRRKAPNP